MSTTLTKTTRHKVKKGESLINICKSYGVTDHDAVWNDKDNDKLKKLRKKPEAIQTDDEIVINPPGPDAKEVSAALKEMDLLIESLENKYTRLEQCKSELPAIKRDILAELAASYKQAKKTGDATDTAATVALMLVDLTKLASKAHKSIKLNGELLEQANREFLKDVGKMKIGQARDIAANVVKDTEPKNSAATNLLIATADAWDKMTSPSFWAYGYVKGLEEWKKSGSIPRAWNAGATADPKSDYQDAINNVEKQIAANMKKLDDAITIVKSRLNESRKQRAAYEKNPQSPRPR